MYPKKENLKSVIYGSVIFAFVWMMVWGCAPAPKVSQAEMDAQAREAARQDSIARDFELKKNWSLGYENYKNKEYTRVVPYFWKVIELDKYKTFLSVYNLLGRTYFELGKPDSAQVVYEHGLKEDPDNVFLNRSLGHIYSSRYMDDKAIASYEKVVKLEPGKENDLVALGTLYRKTDQIENAVEIYKQLVQMQPDNLEYRQTLNGLYSQTGNQEAQVTGWEEILAKDPENKQALWDLTNYYRNERDWNNAINYMKKILALTPTDVSARKDLAFFYKTNEQFQDAINEYATILKNDPNNAEILTEQADCYKELRDLSRARSIARKALRAESGYGKANIIIAQCYELTVDKCQRDANRAGANYYDKLAYEMASTEYDKALRDMRVADLARSYKDALVPVLPTKGDKFLHKNKKLTDPAADCYHWMVK
ncbi:MAG: tetratricopeptide repeat protein [Deferribacteres bacterium]|nr:tetratricopeptide repeat protein [candidate division KSB1 bacterium]MCB9502667.1 tetratricopeptide repeat protein [Deferribacteres bacterium]